MLSGLHGRGSSGREQSATSSAGSPPNAFFCARAITTSDRGIYAAARTNAGSDIPPHGYIFWGRGSIDEATNLIMAEQQLNKHALNRAQRASHPSPRVASVSHLFLYRLIIMRHLHNSVPRSLNANRHLGRDGRPIPCRCGSTTHRRISHHSCPLNRSSRWYSPQANPPPAMVPVPHVASMIPGNILQTILTNPGHTGTSAAPVPQNERIPVQSQVKLEAGAREVEQLAPQQPEEPSKEH